MDVTRTYLDHAAATPMLPAARSAMAEAWSRWANPSSPHAEGRAAKRALEDARERIKAALGWPHELLFTSGATESAAIALNCQALGARAVSSIEHDAVLRSAGGASMLPVDAEGRVLLEVVPEGAVVAVQSVNSETGVIQPIGPMRDAIDAAASLWLCDCSQSAGKLPLPPADFLIVSAHKLGGPPGVGALLVRDLALLEPSGGQERGYRGGTENLPAVLGFAAALDHRPERGHLADLRASLDAWVRESGGMVVADRAPRLPEIASYRLPGVPAAAQLIELDLAGFAVSAGSACSSGTLRQSPVLAAMGWSPAAASEVIRVSFAASTTADEVARFAEAWRRLATRAQAA